MSVIKRARISQDWTLVPHGANTVELRNGVWNTQALTLNDDSGQGHLWPVLKRLREGRSSAEIASEVGVPAHEVESLVDQLIALRVIDDQPRSALDTFLGGAGSSKVQVAPPTRLILLGQNAIHQRVAADLEGQLACSVEILPAGSALWQAVETLSGGLTDGLALATVGERLADLAGCLVVVAAEQNNPLWFTAVDDLARAVGFTWLHATVDGPFVYVGPTVVPGRTASYRTFETRVAMNLRENASYLRYKEALADGEVVAATPLLYQPLVSLVAGHVGLEISNWFATGSNFTVNKVLGLYLPTMEIAYHEILPLPGEGPLDPRQNRDGSELYFDVREWLVDERVSTS